MLIQITSESEILKGFSELIGKLAEAADTDIVSAPFMPLLDNSYCTLMSVSKDEIREINKEQREIDKVTDVLSFPMLEWHEGRLRSDIANCDYELDKDGNRVFNLGDIVLCYDVAIEQAELYGHSVEREVLFLIAHSLLHLLGYDHMTPPEERLMRDKQALIMKKIGLEVTDPSDDEPSETPVDTPEYPAGTPCEHVGYVALLGRPNVGKSTLINYLSGMKVAIVSHKPQTTRTNIRSIYNTEDSQIIFVDTPGVHSPKSKMAEIMVERSYNSAKNADLVLLMVDARFPKPGKVESDLLAKLSQSGKKVILVINKEDEIKTEARLPIIAAYSALAQFEEIVPISAKTGHNIELLLEVIKKNLHSGPRLFDSGYMTDQTEREIAKEMIREQILHYTNQEIPHGVAVEITKFEDRYKDDSSDEYDRELVVIEASIICERKSHKGIIIGKDGQMLKRIGTAARRNIERMTGCKCYLDLFVKYREDWKNDDIFLKQFGFTSEDED
ncbi:rRNA maturation RNase YbeY/GTP-binding protein Era,TIGR00436 [Ruminococcaceae bacterium YRB3002]|nr:rRNA maturation RNase YbeY/GTP-binding protein Era,TIGR00436 [Ruminococcaceae bacterium YRB3002]